MSDAPAAGRLEIDRVIQQLLAVLSRNLGPFVAAAILLAGLPQVVIVLLGLRAGQGAGAFSTFIAALAAGAAALVLEAGLMIATLADLKGEPVSIGDSLREGAGKFVGVFVIALMSGIGVALGVLLLVVPGLILGVMWCVAIPSYLGEGRAEFMSSLSRSSELTRANRWRVFGLIAIGFLMILALQLVVLVVAGGGFAGLAANRNSLGAGLGSAVASAIGTLFWSVGAAVLYTELRRLKGGSAAEGLASEFG